ncbi:MAG: MASE1 domain-containing protein [Phycisphaerales bacterium]|nr:MASE1 domain-containing protein [Phycisphaerales bacterium]
MTSTHRPSKRGELLKGVPIVALATFVTMTLTFRMVPQFYGTSELPVYPIWPAAGVNMALLWLLGAACWPGVLIGSALANLLAFWGEPYVISYALLSPLGNTIEAWLGVVLLRRTCNGGHPLRSLHGAARLILLAGIVATVTGGLVSVTLIHLVETRHWATFPNILLEWNLSSFIAVLVFVPIIIVWKGIRPIRWTGTRLAQALVLALSLVVVQAWLFQSHTPGMWIPPEPLVLISLPLVFWAGSQFGAAGAAIAVCFTATTAIVGTMLGVGPIDSLSGAQRLIVLQAYILIIAVVGILIGAVSCEREDARRSLERRAAFDRLLFDELNHRVRNTLASLLSIVEMGKRDATSVEDYSSLVIGRIHAMARVHDMLTDQRWKPISFRSLLASIAAELPQARVQVEGDKVMLVPAQAVAAGMILHELLTNAHRHGALSHPTGSVRVSLSYDPLTARLRIDWTESAPLKPAVHWQPGDGMRLIEGLVRSDLRGSAHLEITPEGAHHRFEIIVDREAHEPRLAAG